MVAGPPSASAKTTVVRQLSQRSKSVAVGAPKAGGAAAGKAGGGAATKTPTATSSSSATTRPARQSSIDFRGDAHKLYSQYASRSDGVIIKRQLVGLMKGLQKKGKFKFSSEERLKAFVDREFAKHDINADGKLSFEEFIEFYARWFDENAQAMVDAHQMQACRVETAFMRYDTNHDFQITSDELRHLVEEMQPSGMPKPPEAELQACVDELMKLDVNRNGGISFEEFSVGYNAMIDRIGALHAEQRRKVMEGHVGFRGMIKDESERQALEKATSHRYDGKVWVVSESELAGARERAHAAGKFALFLDAPPGELDLPTARYAAKMGARCKVLNMQQLVMHLAEKSMTADEVCAQLRDEVLECMRSGTQLLLRLGHTAPDFMGSWNRPDLPIDFLTPEGKQPGPLPPFLHRMVQPPQKAQDVQIDAAYDLVVTSCFNMDDYHSFLRSKIPLQYMQPIQVMPTLAEVAEVLRDGLPKSEDDDVFAEMDRLANLL